MFATQLATVCMYLLNLADMIYVFVNGPSCIFTDTENELGRS